MMALGDVELVNLTVDDFKYLYNLILADEREEITYARFLGTMADYCKSAWTVYYRGVRFGVGLGLYVNKQWMMEGLKDRSVKGVPFAASIEAGRMMQEILFKETDVLFTYARVEQKVIQYLCEKLGFQKLSTCNNLVVYKKEKVCHSFQQ